MSRGCTQFESGQVDVQACVAHCACNLHSAGMPVERANPAEVSGRQRFQAQPPIQSLFTHMPGPLACIPTQSSHACASLVRPQDFRTPKRAATGNGPTPKAGLSPIAPPATSPTAGTPLNMTPGNTHFTSRQNVSTWHGRRGQGGTAGDKADMLQAFRAGRGL